MAMTHEVVALCVFILAEFDDGVAAALLGVHTFVLRPSLDFVLHHVVRHSLLLGLALVSRAVPGLQFRDADASDDSDLGFLAHLGQVECSA